MTTSSSVTCISNQIKIQSRSTTRLFSFNQNTVAISYTCALRSNMPSLVSFDKVCVFMSHISTPPQKAAFAVPMFVASA